MRIPFLALGALVVAAACASSLSPKASALTEADESGVKGCTLLGTVEGTSMIGGTFPVSSKNAMADAREQAAAMGATHLVFTSVQKGGFASTGAATARAYLCR